jgi:tetratricopeptide (TPR) repeat protein
VSAGPLVGRTREVAALNSVIERGQSGGEVLLLTGEPGIGKSALLAEARAGARDLGNTVLDAVGVENEMHLPFGGLQQLLAPLMKNRAVLQAAQRVALETALGLADGPAPELFLIAEAAFALLSELRSSGPVLVMIDDVQWLDPQSHQILTFIAHRAVTSGICVIAAVRTGHPGPFADSGFPGFEVRGLDEGTAEMILREHAVGLGPSALRRIRQEALGNPLALLELPRAWADEAPTDEHPVPLSLRLERAFAGRVSELPSATRDALLIAAISSSNDAKEITAALGEFGTLEPSIAHFIPAADAGLISFNGTAVEFRHPLVRSGVLQREPLTRQHKAHSALAQVLVDDSYRRAWHRALSIVGPNDQISQELADTVADSLRRGALMTAVSSLERSAQLASTPTMRGELLVQAVQLAFRAGRVDVVQRILRQVSFVDLKELDHARLVWIREALNPDVTSNTEHVRELCDAALRADFLGDTGLALNILVSAALRCWWVDSHEEGKRKVLDALDQLSNGASDPRHVNAIAIADPVFGAAEVMVTLETLDFESVTDGDDLRTYGMAAYGIGDLALATDLFDRAEQVFREEGRLGYLPVVLALQLHIRLELGDWAGAAFAIEEVNTVSLETGQTVFADNNVLVEARALALRGDWRQALKRIENAEEEATRLRVNDRVCLAYQARGTALLSADRPTEAFECLKRQYDPDDVGYHLRESFSHVAMMAEAAVDSGRLVEARSILEALETVAIVTPSPLLEANLLYARAVLAPEHLRELRFREAFKHNLTRWPWIGARIQLEFGRWLVSVNRREEAQGPLQIADAVFKRIGAERWTRKTEAALGGSDPESGSGGGEDS